VGCILLRTADGVAPAGTESFNASIADGLRTLTVVSY
jgi:hypothetical protein